MLWRKPLPGFFWPKGNNKSWNFCAEKNFYRQLICHFKEKKLMMIDCFCVDEKFKKFQKIRRNFDRIRRFRLILFGNESPESDILLQKQRNFFGCQHRVHQSTIAFFSSFFCNRVGIGKVATPSTWFNRLQIFPLFNWKLLLLLLLQPLWCWNWIELFFFSPKDS